MEAKIKLILNTASSRLEAQKLLQREKFREEDIVRILQKYYRLISLNLVEMFRNLILNVFGSKKRVTWEHAVSFTFWKTVFSVITRQYTFVKSQHSIVEWIAKQKSNDSKRSANSTRWIRSKHSYVKSRSSQESSTKQTWSFGEQYWWTSTRLQASARLFTHSKFTRIKPPRVELDSS